MCNGGKGTFAPKFRLRVKVTDLGNVRFAVQIAGVCWTRNNAY